MESSGKRYPRDSFVLEPLRFFADPADVELVIVGLAPYPREQSSECGIPFFDVNVTSWDDASFSKCLSLRMITLAALEHKYGKKGAFNNLADLRKKLKDHVDQKSMFIEWMSAGVLLLNAAPTLPLKEKEKGKGGHAKKWRSVLDTILMRIFEAKSKAESKKSIAFSLWGKQANDLEPTIQKLSKVSFVTLFSVV